MLCCNCMYVYLLVCSCMEERHLAECRSWKSNQIKSNQQNNGVQLQSHLRITQKKMLLIHTTSLVKPCTLYTPTWVHCTSVCWARDNLMSQPLQYHVGLWVCCRQSITVASIEFLQQVWLWEPLIRASAWLRLKFFVGFLKYVHSCSRVFHYCSNRSTLA